MKKRALFLIPCCQRKQPGGYNATWKEIHLSGHHNQFDFLDRYRDQLFSFYSELPQERAFGVYESRRSRQNRGKRIIEAWQKNLNIYKSAIMMAIDRYNGLLYRSLNKKFPELIRNNEIDNIIIISALLGLLAPTDSIPDYELTMKDEAPGNKRVWKYWAETFRNREIKKAINLKFSKFDYIFCLLSTTTGYAHAIAELLYDYDSYILKSREKGLPKILSSWGSILNDSILSQINCPDEVERIAQMYNCEMTTFNSLRSKERSHYEYENKSFFLEGNQKQIKRTGHFGGRMSQADEIRDFVQKHYIEPSRQRGERTIVIRAGDVDKKMRLGRVPNVNQVLSGMILQNICGVRLINRKGPYQSTTTQYTFEILYGKEKDKE
jgi:cytoplasmic iron level regulating protein YaaA (DUF328/UPF0246 family)